ncbi:MAG: hypothetical protein OXN25_05620 [Candidatus Poribacteria bacterium]|nr:hypothetical protein [Candidatus Poribacteria bacterium]
MNKDRQMNQFDYKSFYRRNLPHIQPPGATFFVTFRLAGSIPQVVFQRWKAEQDQLESEKLRRLELQNSECLTAVEQTIFERKREWFRKFEKMLDIAQNGPVWLKDARIAKEVAERMHYLDGRLYHLDAYCIMANHVHIVFTPLPIQVSGVRQTESVLTNDHDAQTKSSCYNTLSSIMQSLKGYTARRANQVLNRHGTFWHHESYDHAVRNPDEWQRIITYILNNPVKVGLVGEWKEWQWSYYRSNSSS